MASEQIPIQKELLETEKISEDIQENYEELENFDDLLKVAPSKLWFVLAGFIWLTAIGFLWLFLGTISIELEGQGMLAENTCIAKPQAEAQGSNQSQVNCELFVDGFFPLNRSENIKVGQEARIEFFNVPPEIPGTLKARVESIELLPASASSIERLTTDPKLSAVLLGAEGIAAQVRLKIYADPKDRQKYADKMQKGMIGKIHLIVDNIQPISMLLR